MAKMPSWIEVSNMRRHPTENAVLFDVRIRRNLAAWRVFWSLANKNYVIPWYKKPLAVYLITWAWWKGTQLHG